MVEKLSGNLEQLYDEWYSNAYMDDWPAWKKNRVKKILLSLRLSQKGRALDLGCGSGVFTRVLKEALPGWEIYGSDISEVAMKIGEERSSGVQYVKPSDCRKDYYDLVFTHHVLEHVDDITSIVSDASAYAKKEAKMLHILPCGNPGSLEYFLASKRKNGIDKNKGNTFFFEEEMHLNRFTSAQLSSYFKKQNWSLADSYYANHCLGVFSWLGGMNTQYIKRVTQTRDIVQKIDKFKINFLKIALIIFYYLQRPYTYFKLRKLNKAWTGPLLRHPQLRQKRIFGLAEILLFPSFFFVLLLDFFERLDWFISKKEESGGEMYLIFERN